MPRNNRPSIYRLDLPESFAGGHQLHIGPKCDTCGYYGRWPDPDVCRVCEHRKAQEAWLESDDPEAMELAGRNEAMRRGLETKRA